MPKFKPARPPMLRRKAVSGGRPRLLAPVRAFAPTQRRAQVKPILPPRPKLRKILRPKARPLALAKVPTQRPRLLAPVRAFAPVIRKGARPALMAKRTERAVAPKLVRPVAPPVARLRNVLRPIAKSLAVVPSVKVSRATVIPPVPPPVAAVRVVAPSPLPAITPPAPTVRMSLKTDAPLLDGRSRRLVRYLTPAAADYFMTQEYNAALGGKPHGLLRLVRSRYGRAYGYSEQTGFPTIRRGATDEASGGAVSWVAQKLGLISAGQSYPNDFDATLEEEVKDFQRSKGLSADGIVGKNTYKALGYTGSVTTGSAVRSASQPSTSSSALVSGSAVSGGGTFSNLTQQVWFWPAAILVPTAGIIAGILLWPSKKSPASSATLVPA